MVTNPPRKNRKKQLRTAIDLSNEETTVVNMAANCKMPDSMAMKYYFERLLEDAKDMLQTQVSMLSTVLHSAFSPDDPKVMSQISHQIKNVQEMYEILENIQCDKDEYERSFTNHPLPRKN